MPQKRSCAWREKSKSSGLEVQGWRAAPDPMIRAIRSLKFALALAALILHFLPRPLPHVYALRRSSWLESGVHRCEFSDLGGFREVIFSVTGTDVSSGLNMRAVSTASKRVRLRRHRSHSHSTCTVAVLPEAEEVDIQINPVIWKSSLPGLRKRRAGREYNRFGRANPTQAQRADCLLCG